MAFTCHGVIVVHVHVLSFQLVEFSGLLKQVDM